MSKPKRQHFIPKSYLKNFATSQGDKAFVEGKLKAEDKPKESLLSIKDICVDKNLYTIPNIEGDDKYAIEKFYAEKVDSILPEVYRLLVDPSVVYISDKQRAEILMSTMSLFFRTPKFLNFNEQRLDVILDHAVANYKDASGRVNTKFRDYDFDFHSDDIEKVRNELRLKHKKKFLIEHLEDWHKFTQFKMKCAISVFKIYEDIDLITSDNPVTMHSVQGGGLRSIFDPTNIISLPLDPKHFLTIFPNTEEALTDRIFRGDRDKMFALLTNYQVEQNSEEWILGKPGSVEKHVKDQKIYGAHNADNYKRNDELWEKAEDMKELSKLIDSCGGVTGVVAEKILMLRKKRMHKNDPEMRKLINHMAKIGVLKN